MLSNLSLSLSGGETSSVLHLAYGIPSNLLNRSMPELPEVETVVRDLQNLILGKKLKSLKICDEKVWFESEFLPEEIAGRQLANITRRGKYIVYDFEGKYLLQHLRMTGKMLHEESDKIPYNIKDGQSKQLRAFFLFDNDVNYVFYDNRRFGTLTAISDLDVFFSKKAIAPEIFAGTESAADIGVGDYAKEYFIAKTAKLSRPIKSVILDQTVICGPGNIYADEALHFCKIHPLQPAKTILKADLLNLFDALKRVMSEAIAKRGTTASDYLDVNGNPGAFKQYLNAYGRTGERCLVCPDGKIDRVKVGGRSSHYCNQCQILN